LSRTAAPFAPSGYNIAPLPPSPGRPELGAFALC